jgi:hypothetical protein
MLKRFQRRFLVDLGEMEGDYRVFHFRDDIAQSTLYISIAILGVLSMIGIDLFLYRNGSDSLLGLTIYRAIYILISGLVMLGIRRTSKVRIYDRLILGWVLLTILSLLLFKFVRPENLFNTTYDVIIPFAIYILSPLKIIATVILASSFSAGTLAIDYFFKPVAFTPAFSTQLIVHILGLVSGLQIQSYRRRSFKAYIKEKDAREMVAYLANIDSLTKA